MTRFRSLGSCFPLALAAATLAAAATSASAQDNPFRFRLDPLVLEGLYLDQDTESSRFQEYRDLSEGFRVHLGLEGFSEDFRRGLELRIVNGGRDDAFYGLDYDVAGAYRVTITHDKIPHRFGNDGRMLWSVTDDGRYELQDPLQQALQGGNEARIAGGQNVDFNWLNSQIQPYLAVANEVDIGLVRRRTSATVELPTGDALRWRFGYQHESRDGNRAFGASFGFNNVTEVPEPIDYDTDDFTISADWRFGNGVVSGGYRYSQFENNVSTLLWDNPWRATDSTDSNAYSSPSYTFKPGSPPSGSIGGSSKGQIDLAPDNEMGSFFGNGRFDFGEHGWLQAALLWNQYEQDDPLLPHTVNTAVAASPQPYGSARRESEQLRLAVDYGLRFGDGWQLDLRFVHQDYSDDSPRFAWDGYVRFDAAQQNIGRITVPFSWQRQTLSGSLDKDLGDWGDVGFEVRRDVYDREFRETEETAEDVVGLRWDGRLGPAFLRAKAEIGQRDHDGYDVEAMEHTFTNPAGANNQPGLRKYDQADRDFERYSVQGDLPLGDTWSLAGHAALVDADYPDSDKGLTGDETLRYGADLSHELGEKGTLVLYAERSDRDVSMAARQSGSSPSTNPADDWFADFDEINDTFGLSWYRDAADWQAKVIAEYVESDGQADIFSPPGGSPDGAQGFGNYEDYDRTAVTGSYDRDLNANLAVGATVLYEDYSIDSFIRQDLANYLPGALLLVADDGGYTAWSGALRLTVRF